MNGSSIRQAQYRKKCGRKHCPRVKGILNAPFIQSPPILKEDEGPKHPEEYRRVIHWVDIGEMLVVARLPCLAEFDPFYRLQVVRGPESVANLNPRGWKSMIMRSDCT